MIERLRATEQYFFHRQLLNLYVFFDQSRDLRQGASGKRTSHSQGSPQCSVGMTHKPSSLLVKRTMQKTLVPVYYVCLN